MKKRKHYGTAVLGIAGIVMYMICAKFVEYGFIGRKAGAFSQIVIPLNRWTLNSYNIRVFQPALIMAGLMTLLMAPLGLAAAGIGRKTKAAAACTGLGLVLFGVMLALNGFLYKPFFYKMGAAPGMPYHTVMNGIEAVLMLGVLAAHAGGILLGIRGFIENKNRDTLLAFLLFGTAVVFTGSLLYQLFRMVLAVESRSLFTYFNTIVPLGGPYAWLAAVHVRLGMLQKRG